MKWNRMTALAVAVCGSALAATTANAQQMVSSLSSYNGSIVIDRFASQDARLVAYGRLIPSSSIQSGFDASRLGGWTGIGTGYGESAPESRSNMISSGSSSSDIDLRFGPTSGNDRVGLNIQMGPTSGNDRTSIDASLGATSGNDRTVIDANVGATSANDRTGIDLKFGPTSGNDRVASGVDLKFGPTSDNDRTRLDGDMGPTSSNDRTSINAEFGPTSGNDRTVIDAQLGTTSANDRVADVGVASSDLVVIPVTVVSASCDQVSLSFAGSEPVVVTPASVAATRDELCDVADARAKSPSEMANELNSIIGK